MNIEKSVQSTFSKHRESVVIVRISGATPDEASLGTGFIIRSSSTSCLVMTCHHVIEDFVASKHTLSIRFTGNDKEYGAEILHEDEEADLAIIRVCGTPREYSALQFSNAEDVPAETDVCLLGYIFMRPNALPLDPGVSPGITCAPPQVSGPHMKDVVITSANKRGTSGAPVLLGDKVIGVLYCGLIQVQHARSSERVNRALKKWLLLPPDATRSTEEMIGLLQI